MRIAVQTIGRERNSIFVADNFFRHPDRLRTAALRLKYVTLRGAYPGYEARPPWEVRTLAEDLRRVSGLPLDPERFSVSFSIVTKPGSELAPWQRTPHFDGVDVAGVVYLNRPAQCRGGTAFYRHRLSGLESVPQRGGRRIADLMQQHGLSSPEELLQWIMSPPRQDGAGFITQSNDDWELLYLVDMKFNRLVLYRGQMFHSGYIEDGWFGKSLATRRLTLNLFAALDRPRRGWIRKARPESPRSAKRGI